MTRRSRAQAAIADAVTTTIAAAVSATLREHLTAGGTEWATQDEAQDIALPAAQAAVDALLADGWHITALPHLPAPHTPQETHRAHRRT